MKNISSIVAAALVALTLSASARAAGSLVEWDTTGAAGNEATWGTTFNATDITGASLSRGAGLGASAAANNFGATDWTGAANDYFSFGLAVTAGFQADVSTLYIATKSSATGPGTLGLFYSGDNFTTSLYTFNQIAGGTNYLDSAIDLSGVSGLQNLQGGVTFEIKQIGTTADNGGTTSSAGTFRIGDYDGGSSYAPLAIDGTVSAQVLPVPEAQGYALMLAGLVFGLGMRRRAGRSHQSR